MTGRGVLLTGRGVVSPLGVGIDAHWEALCAGRSAVGRCDRLAALGLPASRGAEVASESIQPHLARLPRKQQKLWNRATLLAMLGGALAMEDATLAPGAGDPRRFGVVLGVNMLAWDLGSMLDYLAAAESPATPGVVDMARASSFCMRSINPLDFSLKTLPNLIAGHLAIANDAQGFCRAHTEGHVGGARAIGDAARLIDEGDLDLALCGGADDQLEELFFATHWGGGVIAGDEGPDGLVPGEGSGLLVLEEAEHALARGARVHGELIGFASSAGDGNLAGSGDAARLAERLTRVIDTVLEEAKTAPDLLSLHGDGIAAHEQAEDAALARTLGAVTPSSPRLKLKSAHADLGAASSPVELLACSSVLRQAIIPPAVSDRRTGTTPVLRSALVLALGLFGECSALMLRV
ncbi:MAG TPA: beta-ketoacyl synthase N-terminal-like domain-containing protein [Methylomirabilota bacterium]|nr:beta-ketoacyl synthase N-terminal-like domain-containing protein [Methylomirabilota bacterium]